MRKNHTGFAIIGPFSDAYWASRESNLEDVNLLFGLHKLGHMYVYAANYTPYIYGLKFSSTLTLMPLFFEGFTELGTPYILQTFLACIVSVNFFL